MNILIGSQALAYYSRLKGRQAYDWDLLGEFEENKISKVKDVILEFHPIKTQTDKEIYDVCLKLGHEYASSFETLTVAPVEILKVLKLSCCEHLDKAKHMWDLVQLTDVQLNSYMKDLTERRSLEVKTRIEKQKNEFFNKYPIKRYIEHDLLHPYINSSPTYLRYLKTDSSVDICPDKFESAPLVDKKLLIWEEAMALGLERYLIPKIVKVPMFYKVAYERFKRVETSADPALLFLSRLSIPGKLADHPEFISKWALEHSTELLEGFKEWWQSTLEKLPKEFWLKILNTKETL